jgi:hypothetical protein
MAIFKEESLKIIKCHPQGLTLNFAAFLYKYIKKYFQILKNAHIFKYVHGILLFVLKHLEFSRVINSS